jgi:hypothetical protein
MHEGVSISAGVMRSRRSGGERGGRRKEGRKGEASLEYEHDGGRLPLRLGETVLSHTPAPNQADP